MDLETGASISAVSPKIEVLSGAKLVVGPAATSGRFSIFLDCDGDPTIRTPYGNAYCGTKAIRWMLANPEASAAMIKFYDENKGPLPADAVECDEDEDEDEDEY